MSSVERQATNEKRTDNDGSNHPVARHTDIPAPSHQVYRWL